MKKKAIRGLVWNLLDKLISQLGNIALTIYIARSIGPEAYGLIGMLTIFMLLADTVVNGGFANTLIQRSQHLTEDEASTVFWITQVWGVAIYIILYLTAPIIANYYRHPELSQIARVLFIVIIINSATVVARAKLTINLNFKSFAIANTIATIISSVATILMVHFGYGYWALVSLMICKALVSSICICMYCRWVPRCHFKRESFEALFGFGSKLMMADFVASLVNNLYVVVIGRYYNATNVGYFTQATNLSNYLSQFIASTLQGVTYPIMTSIQEDRERLIKIYKQLISLTMVISLPLLIGFSAIASDVISLTLGKEWLPTVDVLVALCIARTVTPISTLNLNILNAIGRSDLFLKVDLSKLPLTLGALFVSIPYGIEGLAWAIVCTSFIAFFINSWYPGKIFGYGGIAQLKQSIPYFVASGIMYFIIIKINLEISIISLIIKISIGGLIYITILAIMQDIWIEKIWDYIRRKINDRCKV
ncbi:MAG: lipopolysaccharide biosynthesis protein [Crocinitomicaceae bacterium]|nr:lipopolysaccharide biosynthesis protein [Crocinitomicaceae bacterium]